jgi:CHAT domain-containing protein
MKSFIKITSFCRPVSIFFYFFIATMMNCVPLGVAEEKEPTPEIIDASLSHSVINLRDAVTVTVTVKNTGDDSPQGGITVSFPDADIEILETNGTIYPIGSEVTKQNVDTGDIEKITTNYLMLEKWILQWESNTEHQLTVTFRPKNPGMVTVFYRAALQIRKKISEFSIVPRENTRNIFTDQQGFPTKPLLLHVLDPDTMKKAIGSLNFVNIPAFSKQIADLEAESNIDISYPLLAYLHRANKNYAQAIEYSRQYLKILEENKNIYYKYAETLYELALSYTETQQLTRAIQLLEQKLPFLTDEQGLPLFKCNVFPCFDLFDFQEYLGYLYAKQGITEKADFYYTAAYRGRYQDSDDNDITQVIISKDSPLYPLIASFYKKQLDIRNRDKNNMEEIQLLEQLFKGLVEKGYIKDRYGWRIETTIAEKIVYRENIDTDNEQELIVFIKPPGMDNYISFFSINLQQDEIFSISVMRKGFGYGERIIIEDINHDGRKELLFSSWSGSGLFLLIDVYQPREDTFTHLFTVSDRNISCGLFDLIDINADGYDELVIWAPFGSFRRDVYGEDLRPISNYLIKAYAWNGNQYVLSEVFQTTQEFACLPGGGGTLAGPKAFIGAAIAEEYIASIAKMKITQENAHEFLGILAEAITIYSFHNEKEKLLHLLNLARQKAEEIENPVLKAVIGYFILKFRAGVYVRVLGDYLRAASLYEELILLYKRLNKSELQEKTCFPELSSLYHNLGVACWHTGEYQQGIDAFHTAITLLKNCDDSESIITSQSMAYSNLAVLYTELNELNSAKHCVLQALELDQQIKRDTGFFYDLLHLANIYSQLGDKELGIDHCIKSIYVAVSRYDTHGMRMGYEQLGNIFLKQKNYTFAKTFFEQALRFSFSEDLSISGGSLYCSLGEIYYGLHEFDAAFRYFDTCHRIADSAFNQEYLWKSDYGKARVYAKQQQIEQAIESYRRALTTIEDLRANVQTEELRLTIFSDKSLVYQDMVQLLAHAYIREPSREYDKLAFQYAEQGKNRLFVEQLTQLSAKISIGISPEFLAKETALTQELIALETSLRQQLSVPEDRQNKELVQELREKRQQLEQEYRELQRQIESEYPRYAELKNPKPITVGQVNKLLRSGEVLLEYFVTNDNLILWAISSTQHQMYILDGTPEMLGSQIRQLRTVIENKQSLDADLLLQLYQQLVESVKSFLSDAKTVYIVPDGPLYYLPFDLLIKSKSSQQIASTTVNRTDFLLNDHLFTYIPSASVLRSIRTDSRWTAPRSDQASLLAFGDPVYSKEELAQDETPSIAMNKGATEIEQSLRNPMTGFEGITFDRLPYTGQEVLTIGVLYNLSDESQAINLRQKALETRVKEFDLTQFRYLHFATHGFLGNQVRGAWQQPSLVLSLYGEEQDEDGKSKNDGFLQMSEVFNLPMHADLVTLSACQTGLGDFIQGEGLVGLTRAFLYAGTPSVVVSLWNVSDLATAHFMEQFYQNLNDDGMSKVEALREAKLDMLDWFYIDKTGQYRIHSHPYYWAPFILIGEWQ